MKNMIVTLLALFIMLPAFAPWFPHSTLHSLHDNRSRHHIEESHNHGHEGHSHSASYEQEIHHPLHFDIVTYFSDYLHVDLQNPEYAALKVDTQDHEGADYIIAKTSPLLAQPIALSQNTRAPPDAVKRDNGKTPLYLSTQRIRI